ncbi:hypothetical protein N7468_007796 [Penicillium chermesinum]|uniref:Uncharacterized protein n=1 Tax=Penicillium chermesinum TaxID=63820 RepID=A0A9W9NRH3_9EURO|nr:uncharacterized protein N7468_007796 [Penicillium chermesinum]KAJ5223254.1 hypothetical protein N7468_007796 [Penicillium chermesinum]
MTGDHMAAQPRVAFISGPTDTGPGESYFHTHYVPQIQRAVIEGDNFVLGPLHSGVDADALRYLLAYPVTPSRIQIFMTPTEDSIRGAELRALGVQVQVIEGRTSQERDAALTRASTYDILRVRTRDESQAFYGRLWSETKRCASCLTG